MYKKANYAIPEHVIAASAKQEKEYREPRYTEAELDEATLHALQDDPHVSALINDPYQLSKAVGHVTSAEKAKLEAAEKRRQREIKRLGSNVSDGDKWRFKARRDEPSSRNAMGRKLYKTRNKKSRRGRRSKRSRRTRRSRK
jgi:hypothetical protein